MARHVRIVMTVMGLAALWSCGDHHTNGLTTGPAGGDSTTTRVSPRLLTLEPLLGDSQITVPSAPLLKPLTVSVRDLTGQPKANVIISWAGDRGSRFESGTVRTDAHGTTSVIWILGAEPGTYHASATAVGADPITFVGRVDTAAHVEVVPDTMRLASLGAIGIFRVKVTADGAVDFAPVTRWSTGDWPNGHGTAVNLSLVGTALVAEAVRNGTSTFATTFGNATLYFTAVVRQVAARATMMVADRTGTQPDTLSLGPGQTAQLRIAAVDAFGHALTDSAAVAARNWVSSDPTVVTVTDSGTASAGADGLALVSSEVDGKTFTAPLRVWTLEAAELAAGFGQVCARLTDGEVACWGARKVGSPEFSVAARPELAFLGTFDAIDNTGYNGCGLRDGYAYCWGWNDFGQLGSSAVAIGVWSPRAVPVSGGLRFALISTGDAVTCGLTLEGLAYCWGDGYGGMLGDGTYGTLACAEGCSPAPVPVSGNRRFVTLSTGGSHVCALTERGEAYCWGLNDYGQLGSPRVLCNGWIAGPPGDRWCSTTPVAVSGDLRFRRISTGAVHTCGITTDGQLYCWGSNYVGTLGVAGLPVPGGPHEQPLRVSTDVEFAELWAGERHSCAIATDGSAYCWGKGDLGNIGSGTAADAPAPVAVAGGLRFRNLTVNVGTSCGVATDGIAYCWGVNALGDGSGTGSPVPRKVAFQRR